MAFLNKVMFIGRLTADPDPPKKVGQNGKFVVKFRYAVGRSKKNPQTGQWENDPHPMYITCEAWIQENGNGVGKVISDYARKGSEIMVEGRLHLDQWDDPNNPGVKKSMHKVVVENVQLLGKPDGAPAGGGGGYQQRPHGGGYDPNEPPAHNGGGEHDGGGYDDGNGDIPF